MNNRVLILPDRRICLFCNLRPRVGNDDLCDECSWRWLGKHSTVPPLDQTPVALPAADWIDAADDDDGEPSILEYAIETLLEKRS